jgi:hypothetical protein
MQLTELVLYRHYLPRLLLIPGLLLCLLRRNPNQQMSLHVQKLLCQYVHPLIPCNQKTMTTSTNIISVAEIISDDYMELLRLNGVAPSKADRGITASTCQSNAY